MTKHEETAATAAAFAPVGAAEHVGLVAPVVRRFAFRMAVGAVAVLLLPASVWFGVGHVRAAVELQPCATEDSVTDCYWDAAERNVPGGRSFEVRDGVIRYADGETVTIPASELEGVER